MKDKDQFNMIEKAQLEKRVMLTSDTKFMNK